VTDTQPPSQPPSHVAVAIRLYAKASSLKMQIKQLYTYTVNIFIYFPVTQNWTVDTQSATPVSLSIHCKQAVREAGTICPRPGLQVDNIFVFIRQVASVPTCWLFKTSATSWPLTFWPWKWCPSHVWCGLPLCQF